MRTHSHHKQVLLFLIAVVLPSTVLVVLTWHMIGQQQELSEKRLVRHNRQDCESSENGGSLKRSLGMALLHPQSLRL